MIRIFKQFLAFLLVITIIRIFGGTACAYQYGYRISADGGLYNVVKIGTRDLDFYGLNGNRVKDTALRRKLALIAWVHERLVNPVLLPLTHWNFVSMLKSKLRLFKEGSRERKP